MTSYNFNQHKHNYAIWTAARAVQRGFTTTKNIKIAIEKSGLRKFAESSVKYSSDQFDRFHKVCSRQLIRAFKEAKLPDVSYGQVAKIIAIYLKTSVVLTGKGICDKSKAIHPPIDSIFLKAVSVSAGLSNLKKIRWTKLNEKEYWRIINQFRSHFDRFDWTLEKYWKPEQEI